MNLFLNPFFYIIFYRFFFGSIWVYAAIVRNTIDIGYLTAIIVSIFFGAAFFLSLIQKARHIYLVANKIDHFKTCDSVRFYLILLIWVILVISRSNSIPLFHLAGSDMIVHVLQENKITNFIVFSVMQAIGVLFLFIGLLDADRIKRNVAIFISLLTVALFMKKSGLLIWILFFFLFQYIFFKKTVSVRGIVVLLGTVLFGALSFYLTIGGDAEFWISLPAIVWNLLFTSSTSYLSYLFIHGGIDYAEAYQSTLPQIVGVFVYIFNPVFQVLFGFGIPAAIGPFVIGQLAGEEIGLFGFNPTLLIEIWFVLGLNWALSVFPFIYVLLILVSRKILQRFTRLQPKRHCLANLYFLFVCLNFVMNIQFDLLNAVRSFIGSIPIYLLFLLFFKVSFRPIRRMPF